MSVTRMVIPGARGTPRFGRNPTLAGPARGECSRARARDKTSGPFPKTFMRILITNDDGIYSPGIAALAEVASRFGEVRIVAPNVEMSSAAHSITASRPLEYKRARIKFANGIDAYAVNGTPADCVSLGAH